MKLNPKKTQQLKHNRPSGSQATLKPSFHDFISNIHCTQSHVPHRMHASESPLKRNSPLEVPQLTGFYSDPPGPKIKR